MSIRSYFKKIFGCDRCADAMCYDLEDRLDLIVKNTKLILKTMASDKQDILDAITGVSADLDEIVVDADATLQKVLDLEAAVAAGPGDNQTAAFAEIKAALAAVKEKSNTAKSKADAAANA